MGSGIEALPMVMNMPQAVLDGIVNAKIRSQRKKSKEMLADDALKNATK